jgi:glycosyltransferase involved in cell wall biosynthesis
MKLGIVVFNWNYAEYLKVLLGKMHGFYNDVEYEIHICDDGSSDNSITVFQDFFKSNNINNAFLHKKESINMGREKPYLGQLENLEKIYKSGKLLGCDYIWLMDADDYMESNDFTSDLKRQIGGFDVVFTNVINKSDNFEEKMEISRRANDDITIWPTISVTSSIIFSMDFLSEFEDEIFNYNDNFDDVWLDSRINMIASRIEKSRVKYIDFNIYRIIHGSNDSGKMPLIRRLSKQIKSNNYYSFVCGDDKPFNIRTKLLDVLFR